jgi:hypothetical protein
MLFKIILAIFLVTPTLGFSFDFTSADASFASRSQGVSKINESRTLYKKALTSGITDKEKTKAIFRLSRLAYYESLLDPTNNVKMKDLFSDCLNYVELIAQTKSVEYYYVKAGCLGGWAFADGSTLAALSKVNSMWENLKTCIAKDPSFDGGGCYRLTGALFGDDRLPGINPTGSVARDYDKSIQYSEISIRTGASSTMDSTYTKDTASGDYFYSAYYFYANALYRKNRKADAVSVLEDAVNRIESGDIPVGREPETKLELKQIKKLLETF